MTLLRHLALRCRDVEQSRRFYEDVLGFTFIGYRSDGISLDLSDGMVNLTLLLHGDQPRPHLEEGEEYIHFGIWVDDVEAIWQRLRAWGTDATKTVKARQALAPDVMPTIAFKTLDPDGNVIDITGDKTEWCGMVV